MDVREKLIEILRKPIFPHELVDPTEAVADYLLDNGVTVQEQEHFREVTKKVEPLTLDELRKMDGEPVYCVEITGREEWLFRRDGGFADMYGEFTSDDFMSWDNYGKLWWCYRQKPEEDDHERF